MNAAQIESAITSIIIAGGGFLVGKGYVTADQVTAFATATTTIFGAVLIVVPIIRKVYTASTTAKIAAVNATPGIKVVSQGAPAPQVSQPPT